MLVCRMYEGTVREGIDVVSTEARSERLDVAMESKSFDSVFEWSPVP